MSTTSILIFIYLVGVAFTSTKYINGIDDTGIPFYKIIMIAAIFPITIFLEIMSIIYHMFGIKLDFNIYIKRSVSDNSDDKSK